MRLGPMLQRFLRFVPMLMGAFPFTVQAQTATRRNALSADELLVFARTMLERGHPEAAIPFLEEVTALQPGRPKAYELLGDAYASADRADRAIDNYEKFLALAPPDSDETAAIQRYIAAVRKPEKTGSR